MIPHLECVAAVCQEVCSFCYCSFHVSTFSSTNVEMAKNGAMTIRKMTLGVMTFCDTQHNSTELHLALPLGMCIAFHALCHYTE